MVSVVNILLLLALLMSSSHHLRASFSDPAPPLQIIPHTIPLISFCCLCHLMYSERLVIGRSLFTLHLLRVEELSKIPRDQRAKNSEFEGVYDTSYFSNIIMTPIERLPDHSLSHNSVGYIRAIWFACDRFLKWSAH